MASQLASNPEEGYKAVNVGLNAGSGRNVPDLSYPPFDDLGYIKGWGADDQPQGYADISPSPEQAQAAPTQRNPEPTPAPQAQPQDPEAPKSAGSELADRLKDL